MFFPILTENVFPFAKFEIFLSSVCEPVNVWNYDLAVGQFIILQEVDIVELVSRKRFWLFFFSSSEHCLLQTKLSPRSVK